MSPCCCRVLETGTASRANRRFTMRRIHETARARAAPHPLTACAGPTVAPRPGTTYEITVTRSWSEATNPLDWPGVTAHFTGESAHAQRRLCDVRSGPDRHTGLEMLSQKGMSTPFDQELARERRQRRRDIPDRRNMAAAARRLAGHRDRCVPGFLRDDGGAEPRLVHRRPGAALKRNGQWIKRKRSRCTPGTPAPTPPRPTRRKRWRSIHSCRSHSTARRCS